MLEGVEIVLSAAFAELDCLELFQEFGSKFEDEHHLANTLGCLESIWLIDVWLESFAPRDREFVKSGCLKEKLEIIELDVVEPEELDSVHVSKEANITA